MNEKRIIEAAETLTPGKFIIWAEEQGHTVTIENKDDVLNVNRDFTILNVDGLRLSFDSGILKR